MTSTFNWQAQPGQIQWSPPPPKRKKKAKAEKLSPQAKAEKVTAFVPFHTGNFVGPT